MAEIVKNPLKRLIAEIQKCINILINTDPKVDPDDLAAIWLLFSTLLTSNLDVNIFIDLVIITGENGLDQINIALQYLPYIIVFKPGYNLLVSSNNSEIIINVILGHQQHKSNIEYDYIISIAPNLDNVLVESNIKESTCIFHQGNAKPNTDPITWKGFNDNNSKKILEYIFEKNIFYSNVDALFASNYPFGSKQLAEIINIPPEITAIGIKGAFAMLIGRFRPIFNQKILFVASSLINPVIAEASQKPATNYNMVNALAKVLRKDTEITDPEKYRQIQYAANAYQETICKLGGEFSDETKGFLIEMLLILTSIQMPCITINPEGNPEVIYSVDESNTPIDLTIMYPEEFEKFKLAGIAGPAYDPLTMNNAINHMKEKGYII